MAKSGGTRATLLALTLLTGGCATTAQLPVASTTPPVLTRSGVQAGDQVVITFYTAAGSLLTEVTGERTVDRNGLIFLPYLGTVEVVGLDTEEVRSLLEELYGALYADPVIEVVTNVNVNITGSVAQPGQLFLPPSTTLVGALAQAGGATSELAQSQGGASDLARVRLVRDGVTTVLDLRPLGAVPDILDLSVQSGDWLFVPRVPRSQIRDDITFYGTVLSTLFTLASLIVLISR